jgi:hypothetical protein
MEVVRAGEEILLSYLTSRYQQQGAQFHTPSSPVPEALYQVIYVSHHISFQFSTDESFDYLRIALLQHPEAIHR